MNILGIGTVFAGGRGVTALEAALAGGWRPPATVASPYDAGLRIPHYAVAPETLADPAAAGGVLRRADRFSRLAVLAARDALADAALPSAAPRIGLVVGTAFGPHVTTFRFLDEILEHGDAGVSPTVFSHSVHNVAAAYAGMAAGLCGPAVTVTHFQFAFHHALLLAEAWLREGRCDLVLAGCVDELGAVLEWACARKLNLAADGRIRPFGCGPAAPAVPGEGAAFFLLAPAGAATGYGSIRAFPPGVPRLPSSAASPAADVLVMEADGGLGDESAYLAAAGGRTRPVTGLAPLFGSQPAAGSALAAAAAALMLKRQTEYPAPVQDNPHNLFVCDRLRQRQLRRIFSYRHGGFAGDGWLELAAAETQHGECTHDEQ